MKQPMQNKRRASRAVWTLLLAVPVVAGAQCRPTPLAARQHAPIARVVVPQFTIVDAPVVIDASASSDDDDDALSFTIHPGDGDASSQDGSTMTHVYATTGSFEVAVDVLDETGRAARVTTSIVVIEGAVVEACSCDAPCLDDALCSASSCVAWGSSDVDDEAPTLPDVPDCAD